jgi:hypothetical protein
VARRADGHKPELVTFNQFARITLRQTKKAGVIFVNGEPFVANQMWLRNMRLSAAPSLLIHRLASQRLKASASSSLATHPSAKRPHPTRAGIAGI